MTDAKWIESLRGKKHTDLSLSQAQALQKMVVDGDLLHIDGAFVNALADLADTGRAEYLGITIEFEAGNWTIRDGGDYARADDAREALLMCQDHADPFKPTPLREPEPPTFDEALAMKCDRLAREDEARALK